MAENQQNPQEKPEISQESKEIPEKNEDSVPEEPKEAFEVQKKGLKHRLKWINFKIKAFLDLRTKVKWFGVTFCNWEEETVAEEEIKSVAKEFTRWVLNVFLSGLVINFAVASLFLWRWTIFTTFAYGIIWWLIERSYKSYVRGKIEANKSLPKTEVTTNVEGQ
jgi:hypothetical protein